MCQYAFSAITLLVWCKNNAMATASEKSGTYCNDNFSKICRNYSIKSSSNMTPIHLQYVVTLLLKCLASQWPSVEWRFITTAKLILINNNSLNVNLSANKTTKQHRKQRQHRDNRNETYKCYSHKFTANVVDISGKSLVTWAFPAVIRRKVSTKEVGPNKTNPHALCFTRMLNNHLLIHLHLHANHFI